MGNYNILSCIKQPIHKNSKKTTFTVATLNYCGVAHNPFEFYSKDYQLQITQISKIFRKTIPLYVPTFNSKFNWKLGKMDKKFQLGRYSNMYSPNVGSEGDTLFNRREFEEKWEAEFDKNKPQNFECSKEERKEAKVYDFVMYHTLLQYVFQTDSFEEAIKNSGADFRAQISPFFQLSFLDERAKLKKFMEGFAKVQSDVFFIQEYSSLLLDWVQGSENLLVITDPREDSLILLNKDSFHSFQSFKEITQEINQEQQKHLRWAESMAFTGADNYIFICVHLSSKEDKNKEQIKNLEKDLLQLKEYLPKYEIIVGGDLNSFFKPEQQFSNNFHMYPLHERQFTTLKKRTYAQAQFHKAEKEVRESKDRIISTKCIEYGDVMYLGGGNVDENAFLPSHEHPYDHLLCFTKIVK